MAELSCTVRRIRHAGLACILATIALGQIDAAHAHPMGNFSVNQYFMLDLRGEVPEVYYLVDIAEIPSFTEMDLLDTDLDNEVSDEETAKYLSMKTPMLFDGLSIRTGGAGVPLTRVNHSLSLLPGTGSLVIFNIVLHARPESWRWPSSGETDIEIVCTNYPKESGIRECRLVLDGRYVDDTDALGDQALGYQTLIWRDDLKNPVYQDFDSQFLFRVGPVTGSPAPGSGTKLVFDWTATARYAPEAGETALLEKLREPVVFFEQSLEADPAATVAPQRTEATETTEVAVPAAPGAETVPGDRDRDRPRGPGTAPPSALLERVAAIVQAEELSTGLMFAAMAIAFALGMGHALSPGHGKTVMAAYLVGERGTIRHAAILGVVVTVTHVWSVLALGLVTLYARESISEERLTFWSGVVSGVIIAGLGVALFMRRYAAFLLATRSGRTHGGAVHWHDHGTDEHQHVVRAKDRTPPTYGSILWLGISGGIVPCPAALIVLLLAIKFGRLPLGLGLLVAFSLGLAAVLVVIGIAVVRAAGWVRRGIGERSPVLLALPVVSSILITLLGLWVVVWTLIQFKVVTIVAA